MAYAEAFQRVEQEFKHLKDQLAAAQITQEQFDAAIKELLVQDAQGRYWTIGVKSGKWYVNEGTQWIEAAPPMEPTANVPLTPSPPPPAWAVASNNPPRVTNPPGKASSRRWIALVLGVVLLLCICICLAIVLAGALGSFLSDPAGLLRFPSLGR